MSTGLGVASTSLATTGNTRSGTTRGGNKQADAYLAAQK
jgi:hypothetical protein